jgi:hypothetical protein
VTLLVCKAFVAVQRAFQLDPLALDPRLAIALATVQPQVERCAWKQSAPGEFHHI